MSVDAQLKKISEMYSENIKNFGTDSRAVGWNTEECQILRFSKLSSVIDTDEPYSVNDYGCGYGSHLLFLTDTLGHKVTKYNGYDISEEMLDRAKENLKDYEGVLKLSSSNEINTQADYSFVSGTFNVKFDASLEEWKEYIAKKLNELDRHSKKGFSFNLLTSYVDWMEPHLYYADPCYWFDFCKKNFSKRVSLLHDYPLWEWTILVKK